MSALDQLSSIGLGGTQEAIGASDRAKGAIEALKAQIEKKQEDANKFKDDLFDSIGGELFRKPIDDLTSKGLAKIPQGLQGVLKKGVQRILPGRAGETPRTIRAPWSEAESLSRPNEAIGAEENPYSNMKVGDLLNNRNAFADYAEQHQLLGQADADAVESVRQSLLNNDLVNKDEFVRDSNALKPPSEGTQTQVSADHGGQAPPESGEERALSEAREGAQEGERIATGAEQTATKAGLLDLAGEVEASGGGPEDIVSDIAAIGLAIGSLFLGNTPTKQVPIPKAISASFQKGL
jgi:hypothetical protein